MIDEIFKVMKHFKGSYINSFGELIISVKGNVYFKATNCSYCGRWLKWAGKDEKNLMLKGE